jgi:lactate permease
VAVSYGAVGVPMTIGIGGGVSAEQAMSIGPQFLQQTYVATSLLHALIGMSIPFVIVIALTRLYKKPLSYAFEMRKTACIAGLLFVVPSLLAAYLRGPEFPSMIGGLVGGLLFIFLLKKNMLPCAKHHWQFEQEGEESEKKIERSLSDYVKALIPYVIIFVLLIISRINLWNVGDILKRVQFSSTNIFGTTLEYTLYPFYSPGFFFLVAASISFGIYRLSRNHVSEIASEVFVKIIKTFVALISVLGIVQIIINTGYNDRGLSSFADQIVAILTKTGFLWPVVSPFIGLFGAFIAGSSTISNLLFSSIQVETALILGFSPILGLALQAVGSAAGNMIAVHNVIAAASVVHLGHAEGKVFKHTLVPALGYALLAGCIIFIISLM